MGWMVRRRSSRRRSQKRKDDEPQHLTKLKEAGKGVDEKAVEAFRAKHGRLDRETVGHLPGWSLETFTVQAHSEGNFSQKATRYKGPKGESLVLLKQVEALLGAHVIAGTDGELKAALETARAMGKEEPKVVSSKVLRPNV